MIRNQKGFTLIEIIAVLVILGILAAVAIPKYMAMQDDAINQAAVGQVSELKGRLSQGLGSYMLANGGNKPLGGVALLAYVNPAGGSAKCSTASTTEGDFTYVCTGVAGTKEVGITVTAVNGTPVNAGTGITRTYSFVD